MPIVDDLYYTDQTQPNNSVKDQDTQQDVKIKPKNLRKCEDVRL